MSDINQLVLYEITVGEKIHNTYNSVKNYNLPKAFDEPKKPIIERFKKWGDETVANPQDHPGRVAALLGVPAALAAGAAAGTGYGAYKVYKHFKNKKNKK